MSSVQPESGGPSPGVRTAINLALFAHLFAIVVATAAYTNPSTLLSRLASVLAPYLQTLNFDVGHVNYRNEARYYLSQGTESDTDYILEVGATSSDGTTHTFSLPEPTVWPGQRYRQQVLANVTGRLTGRDDVQLELLRAVAGRILKDQDATRGNVRCRSRNLPDLPEPGAAVQQPAIEFATAMEAQVIVTGNEVDLLKKSQSAGEVAPVGRSR